MKCGRKVVANHGEKHYALYGQEAIGSTWSLAKMNMFLHGEDNHKIEWGDTIRNPKLLDKNGDLMRFDIVAANPPFRWINGVMRRRGTISSVDSSAGCRPKPRGLRLYPPYD